MTAPSFSLAGKIAFVTGASYGIGHGLARALALAGARVAVGARTREPLEALAKDIGGRSEEHTSELQSQSNLVCRLLLEKKKKQKKRTAGNKSLIHTHPN